MESLRVVLLVTVAVAGGSLALLWLGVLAVRWARRSPGPAAEALVEVEVGGVWGSFTTWLGDQVDSVSDGGSHGGAGCDGHDGGDFDGGDCD